MTVNMNTLIGTPKLMATINSPAMGLKKAFDEKFFSLRENADSQTFKWEQVPITRRPPQPFLTARLLAPRPRPI